jgi:tetratricopeptide (TPR) repeat protein
MIGPEYLEPYLRILGLKGTADPARIKQAYHRAARANHPDLFPDGERPKRELAMMRINEAYMSLLQALDARSGTVPSVSENSPRTEGSRDREATLPGPLKNADYVYYKLGLENYREGQRRFFDRTNAAGRPQHYVPDSQLLGLALAALRRFQKAYACFYRVVSDYPDSIWVRDCRFRLWRLEQYNRVYMRICRRLAEKLDSGRGQKEPC